MTDYCAWCGLSLRDRQGNPCFDLFSGGGPLQFVCRNGCQPGAIIKPNRSVDRMIAGFFHNHVASKGDGLATKLYLV